MNLGLTFDDVLIVPQYSTVESRFDPDTTSPFVELSVPLVSANMDTVTGPEMAVAIGNAGGLGVLHRFSDKETILRNVGMVFGQNDQTAVSLGIGDPKKFSEWAMELVDAGANILVLDVAHGFQQKVLECIEAFRRRFNQDGVLLVAGNVATPNAALSLWNAGADAVKVGIGPGAACTTRAVTGVGYPQFSAVRRCAAGKTEGRWLIADGGIKGTADFVKAIAAGADAVMCGSLFAGCDESPGELIETPEGLRKVYRGSASSESRHDFGKAASNGYNEHIAEGQSGSVSYSGPVAGVLDTYKKALQSAMSYVGATTIPELHKRAEFVRTTPAAAIESGTRI